MKLILIFLLFLIIQPIFVFADIEHHEQRITKTQFEHETFNVVIGSYVKHIHANNGKREGFANKTIGLEYNRNDHTIGFMNFTNSNENNSNSIYYGYTFLDYIFVTTGLTTGYGPIKPPKTGFYILWGFRYRYKMIDIKMMANPPLNTEYFSNPITFGIQFAITIKT